MTTVCRWPLSNRNCKDICHVPPKCPRYYCLGAAFESSSIYIMHWFLLYSFYLHSMYSSYQHRSFHSWSSALSLVSGINFLVLSVNLIPVPRSPTCLFMFTNLSHHRLSSSLRTDSMDFMTGLFLLSISVFLFLVSSLLFLFFLVLCGRLSWLFVSFWAQINIVHRTISQPSSLLEFFLASACTVPLANWCTGLL